MRILTFSDLTLVFRKTYYYLLVCFIIDLVQDMIASLFNKLKKKTTVVFMLGGPGTGKGTQS